MARKTNITKPVAVADHVIVATYWPGYWGRGKTFDEAVRNAKWIEKGRDVIVANVDATARITEMGHLQCRALENQRDARVGKIRSVFVERPRT